MYAAAPTIAPKLGRRFRTQSVRLSKIELTNCQAQFRIQRITLLRELVGLIPVWVSWARRVSVRRRARERPEFADSPADSTDEGAREPVASVLDFEVARPPVTSSFSPILLVYFEGLTHDQAAQRSAPGWALVRSPDGQGTGAVAKPAEPGMGWAGRGPIPAWPPRDCRRPSPPARLCGPSPAGVFGCRARSRSRAGRASGRPWHKPTREP